VTLGGGTEIPPHGLLLWRCAQMSRGTHGGYRSAFSFVAMYFQSFAHVSVTEELLQHVWEGEPNGHQGGHRFGLGREGKTEFPEDWTVATVKKAIRATLSHPHSIQRFEERTFLLREVKCVIVQVEVRHFSGGNTIRSVYPVCGEGVFRNQKGRKQLLPLDISIMEL
jgi:hypothetical protein